MIVRRYARRQFGLGVLFGDGVNFFSVAVILKVAVRLTAGGADRFGGAGWGSARMSCLVSFASCLVWAICIGAFLPVVGGIKGIISVGVRMEFSIGRLDLYRLGRHGKGCALIVGTGQLDVFADDNPLIKHVARGGFICRDRYYHSLRLGSGCLLLDRCLTVGYGNVIYLDIGRFDLYRFPRHIKGSGCAEAVGKSDQFTGYNPLRKTHSLGSGVSNNRDLIPQTCRVAIHTVYLRFSVSNRNEIRHIEGVFSVANGTVAADIFSVQRKRGVAVKRISLGRCYNDTNRISFSCFKYTLLGE